MNNKLTIDSKISLEKMYPQGLDEVRNKLLLLWNVSEESFRKEHKVYVLIVAILRQGYNKKFIKEFVNYFGKDLVIESLKRGKKEGEISKKTIENIFSKI